MKIGTTYLDKRNVLLEAIWRPLPIFKRGCMAEVVIVVAAMRRRRRMSMWVWRSVNRGNRGE
jgi:hypothetical protein